MENNALDKIDMKELGKELKQARIKSGLKQEDVAQIISVARTTIVSIEKGERRIKPEELIKLAHAYNYQISDLIRPRPKLNLSQPQYRSQLLKGESETEIVQSSVEELSQLVHNYFELEKITKTSITYKFPREYDVEGIKISDAAETVALDERNRLGLGDGPIPILRNTLEQEVGLRIFYLPIQPSKISAIYLYDDPVGGCIALNSKHPEERRRWSLAHEYGHFLVHRMKPTVYTEDAYQRKPGSERFADEFAMFFLMPTSGLTRRITEIRRQNNGQIKRMHLWTLANYYGVSISAMAQRLEDLRVLPTGFWEEYKRSGVKVQEIQKKLNLSPIPAQDDKYPKRYQFLAVEAFEKGLITEGMFANFLNISRVEAREIAETFVLEIGGVEYDTIDDIKKDASNIEEDNQ
jgi:Zn-dependent peptidase ImmA (M78 family)/DNA-binding XRE family transcriptional regulator